MTERRLRRSRAAPRAYAFRALVRAVAFSCCGVFLSVAPARAELPLAQRLSLRYSAGASLMLSSDQRSWLAYSAPGLLTDLQLALRLTPSAAVQLGVAGGLFFSAAGNGAVLAPMLGGTVHWPLAGLATYASLNVGAALTGELVRPFARALLGVDWSLSSQLALGPVLGVDVVTQHDGSLYSSDAIYGWAGISLAYRPARAAPHRVTRKPQRMSIAKAPAPHSPPSAALRQLAPAHEPQPPSPELSALLDDAVQVSHLELLAPVLFEYDSIALEPSSVAMLHEVARVLTHERRDVQLLAVVAYADHRGAPAYNLELSSRRARFVRDWLVAHGIARARLTIEPRGASDPVEIGADADHQQNRRVIFRVLRAQEQP